MEMRLTREQAMFEFDGKIYQGLAPLLQLIQGVKATEDPIGEEGLRILTSLVKPTIRLVGVRLGACLRGEQGHKALFLDIETKAGTDKSISVALTDKGYWIKLVGHYEPTEFRQTLSTIPAISFLRAFRWALREGFRERLNQVKFGEGEDRVKELMNKEGKVLDYAGAFQFAIAFIIESIKPIPES